MFWLASSGQLTRPIRTPASHSIYASDLLLWIPLAPECKCSWVNNLRAQNSQFREVYSCVATSILVLVFADLSYLRWDRQRNVSWWFYVRGCDAGFGFLITTAGADFIAGVSVRFFLIQYTSINLLKVQCKYIKNLQVKLSHDLTIAMLKVSYYFKKLQLISWHYLNHYQIRV